MVRSLNYMFIYVDIGRKERLRLIFEMSILVVLCNQLFCRGGWCYNNRSHMGCVVGGPGDSIES